MKKMRMAIVVPYRDRPTHLSTFVKHMRSYLKDFSYQIFVVEQNDNKPFNRGKLLNIGAEYAIKNNFDYICFHDVDMLPINVDYSYPEVPTSLISESENNEGSIFFSYFGGITAFNVQDFKAVNGYSNNYWGWGFEDTDLFYRVSHGGLYFDSKVVGEDDYSLFSIELKENDYIKVPIESEIIDDDFEISITAKVKSSFFDENKEYDEYPIWSIPGYNIGLFYNSFNRYFLQVYDSNKTPYSITTDILDDVTSKFTFRKEGNDITFLMNDEAIGTVTLEAPILNLNNEHMYIGSFSDKELCEFDLTVIDFVINEYHLGTNDMEIFGGIINTGDVIKHRTALPKPVRREGLFRELYHESNASINKAWTHQETRKNQIFYNNFVKQGLVDFKDEGLNSLKYSLVEEEDNMDYLKLSVDL
jgi:hypothetical protein